METEPNNYQTKLTILILIAIVTGYGTSLAYDRIGSWRSNQNLKDEILSTQQQLLSQTREQLELMKLENEKLVERLNDETKQLSDRITTEESIRKATEDKSLINIVNKWEPLIASVRCSFPGANTRGSGTLFRKADGRLGIMTNAHVLTYKDENTPECGFTFPGQDTFNIQVSTNITQAGELDYILVTLNNPPEFIKTIAATKLSSGSPGFKVCGQTPVIGSDIVILGYPTIGSRSGVTVTEGILSGIDNKYFITSAKVERGNSGGAAILVRDNCYLGIPTSVTAGQVESLARILKSSLVF